MSSIILLITISIIIVIKSIDDYRNTPSCKWCDGKHYGRCMFNPRAGKLFANTNDGHFDYNNPNK